MNPVTLFLSPSGRLQPRAFAVAVAIVYLMVFFSQVLLGGHVTGRYGLVPFALVQMAVVWMWYALHARRLRDAGRETGIAIALAVLYALGMILLAMIVLFLVSMDTGSAGAEAGGSPLQMFVLLAIISVVLFGASLGPFGFIILGFVILVLLPVVIAVIFSIWTGTRPSAPQMP
jgi:uncharacterized membrane protein YhaH (DUF805 family)